MECVLAEGVEWPGAVGVSGGGDSLALMFLLADWAADLGLPPPVVLTVDHALRRRSKTVAESVVSRARRHGLVAHVLPWKGRKPRVDIEAAAREARYRLTGDWCRRNGIRSVFLAHSMEDQAETFLLRLIRGSGVDGLAAMSPVATFPTQDCESLRVIRPLLDFPRARLRGYLSNRGETWFEDEMNADIRFARARLRQNWPALQKMGFSAERIAAAARHLSRARSALDRDTQNLLACAARPQGKSVFLDAEAIAAAPEEIGLRAMAHVLMQVSGQFYRPRFDRLERLVAAVRLHRLEGGRTLHGCCIKPAGKRVAFFGPRTVCIAPETGRRRHGKDGAEDFRC